MTSRLNLSMDKLLEVAKQTLGISVISHDAIPAGYLEELRKHVKFSKDDTLFRIYPQPGYGYGSVRCLEQGCEDVTIQLGQKMGSRDNGLNEGLGSLSAYRVHVQEHPTHKANRFARVKAEVYRQTNGTVNRIISLPLQAQYTSTLGAATISQKQAPRSLSTSMDGLVGGGTSHSASHTPYRPMKLEPSADYSSASSPIIPTKRSFEGDDTDIIIPSSSPHSSPSMPKKPKVEQIKASTIQPLGTIDRNSSIPVSSGAPLSSSLMPREARSMLDQTNAAVDTVRTLLTHFHKKARKSVHDKQRILELQKQLQELLATRSHCAPDVSPPIASSLNAHLPAIPPSEIDSFGRLPRTIPPINAGVLPMVPVGLPNYGDTIDYESDDDIRGDRFRDRLPNRGPIAYPGDIDKFLIEAGNSELFDGNESVDKALSKLGLNKLGEHLPFMTIALMPHQVIGVAWMLEHERGSHKGGILADEMGLGKTVQMISTMVQHRSDDPAVKSTLICAPVALLDQWKLEIETKTEGGLSCLIYHGPNKPKFKKDLQKFDVVLTTFQTLALEWPDDRKKKKKKKDQDDSDDFIESDSEKEKKAKKKEGLLLRMKWFRVVLDEAQNIRNRNTRISNAVTFVDTTYRWCLTGTPVINSLADGYALMRFLQIRPWYDWEDFNNHIARLERKRPDLASSRLQAILNACLIRRKKDSVLDGKKLIELPPKDVILRKLTFTQDERDIYDVIEKRSQSIINKYLRTGTILKNYSSVLVLLLRLRQLCNHPCLIQEGGDAFLLPDEDSTLGYRVQSELERATTLAGEQFVTALKAKLKATALERMAAERASAEAATEDECPICFDTLTDPIVTRCGHVFCAECIDSVMKQLPIEDGNEARHAISQRPCPTCREPIQKEMIFQRKAFEPTGADLDETQPGSPAVMDEDEDEDEDDGQPIGADLLPVIIMPSERGQEKANKRITKRIQESDEDYDNSDNSLSDFIVESDEDEEVKGARRELKQKLPRNKRIVLDSDEDSQVDDEVELLPPTAVRKKKGKTVQRFLPSTKMKEMMTLLKEWADKEETKNEKTIVISQWTSCLDLIADYLDENGFTFVRYQGDMSRLARDEAVRIFMCQGKARVMLMSLKCGGVGLNLTRANRVISLDLGWSPAIENQAFDRVHRLGQVRPVSVQRLVIEDTVEARILALQERKQNLADGSLGEGTGKKLGRLSVKDLANLFGLDVRGREL